MSAKHTPGPWRAGVTPDDLARNGERELAVVEHSIYDAIDIFVPAQPRPTHLSAARRAIDELYEHQANAYLIAAAPELLETLAWLDSKGGLGLDVHERIRAVLAKARGES